jgi:hypothetical protein
MANSEYRIVQFVARVSREIGDAPPAFPCAHAGIIIRYSPFSIGFIHLHPLHVHSPILRPLQPPPCGPGFGDIRFVRIPRR